MSDEKVVIWIFGCQRSGTTATLNGLGQMADSVTAFDEMNDIIHDPSRLEEHRMIRLKPAEQLKEIFSRQRSRVIVAKPLMESQRASELLDEFPTSVGLWLLRGYRAVANSMIQKWGDQAGYTQLLPIIHGQGTWREEKVPQNVAEKIRELAKPNMPLADGCALFWYMRNALYHAQHLDSHARVAVVQYERLVTEGGYLTDRLKSVGIHSKVEPDFYNDGSLKKGSEISLSPEIDQLCSNLEQRILKPPTDRALDTLAIATLRKQPKRELEAQNGIRKAVPFLRNYYQTKSKLCELKERFAKTREQRDLYKRKYEALRQRFDAYIDQNR
ncbi:MAG: hypothetical protein AAF585_20065 [Verrucomicrobiota bacterium]